MTSERFLSEPLSLSRIPDRSSLHVSVLPVGSSWRVSERLCERPDRQRDRELEGHVEEGRGQYSWRQGRAPTPTLFKPTQGPRCQSTRCGGCSAFMDTMNWFRRLSRAHYVIQVIGTATKHSMLQNSLVWFVQYCFFIISLQQY